jgi:hypothetical protein
MIHLGRLYFWFYNPFSVTAKWGRTIYPPKVMPREEFRIHWMLFFGWFAVVWYRPLKPN